MGDLIDFLKNFRAFVIGVRYVGVVANDRVEFTKQKDGIFADYAYTPLTQFENRVEVGFVHRHKIRKPGEVFAGHSAGAMCERQAVVPGVLACPTVG